MYKLKKLLALAICAVIFTSLNIPVYAQTKSNAPSKMSVNEVNVPYIDFTNEDISSNEEKSKNNILEHNNGKPIEANIFKNGENDGNNLFAVYYTTVNGLPCESFYFSNRDSIAQDELLELVNDTEANNYDLNSTTISKIKEENIDNNIISSLSISATNSHIRSYNWSFYDKNLKQATLSTSVALTRKSKTTNYNGKTASVWDIVSTSQLEKLKAMRLNEQYTRLDVSSYSSEDFVDYGPTQSTSGGSLNVGLDALGVASVSYSFSIDGFSITNLTSMANNYGRWKFWDGIGNEDEFTTEPGIRATNTSGNFAVDLSHSVNIRTYNGASSVHNTGVVQIIVSDR